MSTHQQRFEPPGMRIMYPFPKRVSKVISPIGDITEREFELYEPARNSLARKVSSMDISKPGKARRFAWGLVGLAALGLTYGGLKFLSKPKNLVYEYAVSRGIPKETSKKLAERISFPMEENSKEFIKAVAASPKGLQKALVASDILDNRQVSAAELEATRRATMIEKTPIANPREAYFVLANAPGHTYPEKYSQRNNEFALGGILSFYKLIKTLGVDDEHIELLVYNPSKIDFYDNAATRFVKQGKLLLPTGVTAEQIIPIEGDEIKVDRFSSLENFLETVRRLKSDKNDLVYIVLAAPAPNAPDKIDPEVGTNKTAIEFDDGYLTAHLLRAIFNGNGDDSMYRYEKALVIGQTCEAQALLTEFPEPYGAYLPLYENETFVISSANDHSIANETFLMRLVATYLGNPKISKEQIVDSLNTVHTGRRGILARLYHNSKGARNPLESETYKKPLFEF